ncbi:glucosyl-dolichyl phosphate glucuronosyltransferase [Halorhabdus sp. BNX81]|uniref:glucosyl-dolichyl phosphate glucuronosyltransferase n=1 Tax=Halorhabdus sp. BNX81 TaxID=2980181 RepID=UPI0023DD39EC|nr:glucosyl-dolichyl phosphate glucuronosyltransferase [Halorhabdus sp. BNX81]WEL21112.1 Glycosyl transferase family 2 [Halorhabdus sp. BNX81]
MRVSVVLCIHTLDRYDDFTEAVESVRAQTYDDVELVLVSDGSDAVFEQFRTDFGEDDDATLVKLAENRGLLEARNAGAEAASGDVVAFLDDDAIAAPDWIERLVAGYEKRDAIAVGGKMTPEWVAGKPDFLPAEFYWLVGVTHRGFGPDGDMDAAGEVRNTFGSNISFRRDVFLELGGFDTNIGGRQGDANLQGGETELCARLREEYTEGVWYVPEAEVAHKVFEYRTEISWLLDRAFWQGYSKRAMEVLVPESGSEERGFLSLLAGRFLPMRLRKLVSGPNRERLLKCMMLLVFTGVVGVGYLYGGIKYSRLFMDGSDR